VPWRRHRALAAVGDAAGEHVVVDVAARPRGQLDLRACARLRRVRRKFAQHRHGLGLDAQQACGAADPSFERHDPAPGEKGAPMARHWKGR